MSKHAHSFAERHPEKKEEILRRAEQDSAFHDMCQRFGELWDSLSETETDPSDADRRRSEAKKLELEMLSMIGGGGRV